MIGVTFGAQRATSELRAGDALVRVRCVDDAVCRVEVRTDDGTATAGLVRKAVVNAFQSGLQAVAMTLDVSSPACGAVLAELRDLAGRGVGRLQVRRAGETVLVDVDLTPPVSTPLARWTVLSAVSA